ncbi:MAG: Leader peptidase PppA [Planctomycetes bacterium]|nr:Leader peptidase PppA [Planctomycetota bacterium]
MPSSAPTPAALLAAAPLDQVPHAFWWAAAVLFGANVGSFLNVVAHRLPMGLSVVRPRSRCPECRTPIGALDNIPILSWMLLRGRCRGCKGRISARYAAVEALTGVLFAVVVHVLVIAPGAAGEPSRWIWAGAVAVLTAALLAASLIDLDHTILPDEITLGWMWPAPVVAALVPELTLGADLGAPAWLPGACEDWPVRVIAAVASLAGIVVGGGIVWGIRASGSLILGKEAMGFGDVKFQGMIGGWTGPAGALLSLVAASVVGAAAGVVRMIVTKDRYVPFGPFLAIGAWLFMLWGGAFLGWYLGLLGRG